jgi:fructose-1,6-bisphosphatase I
MLIKHHDSLTEELYRHVLSDQLRLGAAATGDLTLLLTAIQVTSKFIATNVRRARLINL